MGPIREMLAGSGVNEQKWRVLRVLEERGPLEQKAIAEAACLFVPSLSRILVAMEADDLVDRRIDPADRRRSIVSIAERGRTVLRDQAEASAAINAEIEARFGAANLDTLLDLLDELRRCLDREADKIRTK